MRRLLPCLLTALLSAWSCTPALEPRPRRDAGTAAENDGGETENNDGGSTPTPSGPPADTVFSFGITDNSGGAPQSAPYVNLVFNGGTPGADTVVATRIYAPITLDGNAADWSEIPASVIPLQNRGEPIGMSKASWDAEYALFGGSIPLYDFNITNAIVKAAWDEQNIYFLVEWADATENKSRDALTLGPNGWVRSTENEDRLYFGFNINDSFPGFAVLGCSAGCHMNSRLGETSSEARAWRMRMHSLNPGELVDLWSWRAFTTNGTGAADDNYWDEVQRKPDSATDFVVSNRRTLPDGGIVPIYMAETGVNSNAPAIFLEDAGISPKAILYDPTDADAGVRIPGYVFQRASPNRDDVRATGKWLNGKWTVELSRALTNSDPKDVQFPLQ